MPSIQNKVEHVIVLMLENRSFDSVLGWSVNPQSMPDLPPAAYTLSADPDHSHAGVMWQLLGKKPTAFPAPTAPLTMDGFEASYTHVGGVGDDVLRGFKPHNVPVLSTLAREYATCTRWFCSVPGQTWPNRNFVHAGTSDGEVDIDVRLYRNPTIFERIEDAGGSWRVYHQGPAQVWCFPDLWFHPFENRFDDHDDLLDDIRKDRLPMYSFVEPDHGLIFKDAQWSSNSQHPTNNERDGRDFCAGEQLLHEIYSALIANDAVFRKTLLVVTYDEHGGLADHVPPHTAIPVPPPAVDDDGRAVFGFNLLGPRVPTVLISPWIPRGAVDDTVYDHTAIPRSLRALFAPTSKPLSDREAASQMFLHNLSLGSVRPDRPATVPPEPPTLSGFETVIPASAEMASTPRPLDDFQQSLVELSRTVDKVLRESRHDTVRDFEAFADSVAAPPPRQFATEAERQLFLSDVTRRLQRAQPR